jgi:hypothetical protein
MSRAFLLIRVLLGKCRELALIIIIFHCCNKINVALEGFDNVTNFGLVYVIHASLKMLNIFSFTYRRLWVSNKGLGTNLNVSSMSVCYKFHFEPKKKKQNYYFLFEMSNPAENSLVLICVKFCLNHISPGIFLTK